MMVPSRASTSVASLVADGGQFVAGGQLPEGTAMHHGHQHHHGKQAREEQATRADATIGSRSGGVSRRAFPSLARASRPVCV